MLVSIYAVLVWCLSWKIAFWVVLLVWKYPNPLTIQLNIDHYWQNLLAIEATNPCAFLLRIRNSIYSFSHEQSQIPTYPTCLHTSRHYSCSSYSSGPLVLHVCFFIDHNQWSKHTKMGDLFLIPDMLAG